MSFASDIVVPSPSLPVLYLARCYPQRDNLSPSPSLFLFEVCLHEMSEGSEHAGAEIQPVSVMVEKEKQVASEVSFSTPLQPISP